MDSNLNSKIAEYLVTVSGGRINLNALQINTIIDMVRSSSVTLRVAKYMYNPNGDKWNFIRSIPVHSHTEDEIIRIFSVTKQEGVYKYIFRDIQYLTDNANLFD